MAVNIPTRASATSSVARVSDPFAAMRQDFNELLANFWNGSGLNIPRSAFAPELDIAERDNSFELRMDIPGMEAKDLDIQVHDNTVTISGQRKEEKEEKGKTFHRIERRSGSFSRTVTLPCSVNEKEVAAEYTNGVLSVVLPKCEESKSRKITVKG